ncbi:hypothetical protein BDZ45DRAFT_28966 [Acephala macrosclerotiorum]|nr:hypothetical protein BDZ45DRAFT_28966 [Acephala macrosclerotiorum]
MTPSARALIRLRFSNCVTYSDFELYTKAMSERQVISDGSKPWESSGPAKPAALPEEPGPFELAIKNLPKECFKPSTVPSNTKYEGDAKDTLNSEQSKAFDFSPMSQDLPFSFRHQLRPFSTSSFILNTTTRKTRPVLSFMTTDSRVFTLFKKLPFELQIKIWNHAIADIDPRIVTLAPKSGEVPALLNTCHASRKELRRAFTVLIDLGLQYGQRTGFEALVNYETDTVFLKEMKYCREYGNNPLSYAMQFYPSFLAPVKKLAIKLQRFEYVDFHRSWVKGCFFWDRLGMACPELEELIFDLEGLAYYTNDGSIVTRTAAVKCFKEVLGVSLGEEQKEGRRKGLVVYTTTTLREGDNVGAFECFSRGGRRGQYIA